MQKNLILKELSRYDSDTYAYLLYRNAILYPEAIAFKCENKTLTFFEFNQRINKLIHGLLGLGLKRGDVIGILSWNSIEYAEIYGCGMKGGFIISPFNPRLSDRELKYVINYSECKTLFFQQEFKEAVFRLKEELQTVSQCICTGKEKLPDVISYDFFEGFPEEEPPIDIQGDHPVFLFYTSGTTGTPRGSLYTHRRAIRDTLRFIMALGIEPGDKQVQIMPLFHIGGAKNFWGYFCAGASNIIIPRKTFDPELTLKIIEEEKATDIHIVPTHLAAFLSLPNVDTYDLSSIKRMFYAASPMPVELLKSGIEKWGPMFVQFYGSTETGPNVTMLSKKHHEVIYGTPEEQKILGSCGLPHVGVHVRIVDENGQDLEPNEIGEIIVKSDAVMKEYWKMPEVTKEVVKEGWVYTGDMGFYDEKGFIYIVDRKKDMICSGGENIYPREIEEVLYQHPKVKEACVIGIPDEYWVEKVHAVVVLKEGETATEQEIIDFVKARIARYKAPKSVEFVDSLPKTPSGKILKRELREKYWKGRDRRV